MQHQRAQRLQSMRRKITLSKPGSHPLAEKVEERYTRSCLNLKPSLITDDDSNISLSGPHRATSGTESRSTKKTGESPTTGSDGRRRTRQAIWRRDTVGNDRAGRSAAGTPSPPPTVSWWWSRIVRLGFHSASRPTTGELRRAQQRSANSGESAAATTWISIIGGGGRSGWNGSIASGPDRFVLMAPGSYLRPSSGRKKLVGPPHD